MEGQTGCKTYIKMGILAKKQQGKGVEKKVGFFQRILKTLKQLVLWKL